MSNSDQLIQNVLKSTTGHRDFLPGQEEALRWLWDGEHTILRTKTSGGKSLPYILFTQLRLESKESDSEANITVVVEPLVALAQDSASSTNAMEQLGFRSAVVTGSQNAARDFLASVVESSKDDDPVRFSCPIGLLSPDRVCGIGSSSLQLNVSSLLKTWQPGVESSKESP